MTSAFAIAPIVVLGLVLACLAPVLWQLYRKCRVEEITSEWLENFSASSYQPMATLLNDIDVKDAMRRPGFDLASYRKQRKERMRLFHDYLKRMIVDFNRLHLAARVITAHMPVDHSSTMIKLIRMKLQFSWLIVRAEGNYLLCHISLRSVGVHSLLLHLEEMNQQLLLASSAQGLA